MLDNISFYFEIKGNKITLPVNPASISIDVAGRNQSSDVLRLGEITQLTTKGLKGLSFSSLFPLDTNRPFVKEGTTYKKPEDYVALFEEAMDSEKPIRCIIGETKINMLMSIESFTWEITDTTGDIDYSIQLKEYREYFPKYIKSPQKPITRAPSRPTNTGEITVGCTVIVNGRLHRDSYGSAPGQTESNAKRKVSHIIKNPRSNQPFTVHVTTMDGGWRGWVRKSEVRRI